MQSGNEKIELEIEEFRKIFCEDILVNHEWNGSQLYANEIYEKFVKKLRNSSSDILAT